MKQEIITKLFDGTALDSKEALYVANNLKGDGESPTVLPPYDHPHKMTHDACGLTNADIDAFCAHMKKVVDLKDDEKGISGMVEHLENVCRQEPLMTRIVVLQFLKAMANRNPLAMLLGGLLGGMGGK